MKRPLYERKKKHVFVSIFYEQFSAFETNEFTFHVQS